MNRESPVVEPRSGRRRRTLGVLTVVATGVLAVAAPSWAYWTDDVAVSGAAITARVPAPSAMRCALANPPGGGGYANLSFTVTLPAGTGAPGSGSRLEYLVDYRRLDTGQAQAFTPTVSLSGTTLTIAFDDGDVDSVGADTASHDYLARVTVRVAAAPTWTSAAELNFDASNQNLAFPLGGPDRYGSATGTTSPGGQPGRCTT